MLCSFFLPYILRFLLLLFAFYLENILLPFFQSRSTDNIFSLFSFIWGCFDFIPEAYFLWVYNSLLTGFFVLFHFFVFLFLVLEKWATNSLHVFWWEVSCHSSWFSPVSKELFFSGCFQFFFFFTLSSVYSSLCGSEWRSLLWSCLGFTKLHESIGLCFLPDWEFLAIISSSMFLAPLFSPLLPERRGPQY